MKYLILNADDCGFSQSVNRAVKESFSAGAITGTSVLSVGREFPEAIEILKNSGMVEVGAHLALTGKFDYACSEKKRIVSILDEKGTFFGSYREFLGRYFAGKINEEHVYMEFKKQIERLLRFDFKITHIDSHEHIHMLPAIFRVVVRLADEFHVPFIRVPNEGVLVYAKRFSLPNYFRSVALRSVLFLNKGNIASLTLKHNDQFFGHFHSGSITDDVMCFMADNLKDGINEIAFHPATFSQIFIDKYPWYKNSHKELDVLLHGSWRERLAKNNVKLISHKEAAEL
ncbi:MAG: ChbG/HpnK family deacetylase [Candidatus Omnitrophica bacterium]|nr:ChbG/HpnK family deacetylase [Candidatus Omnitrophota bacterium]